MIKTETIKRHFVASAILFYNKQVLLLEHKKLGAWLGPGGHIEQNETPEEAVSREVMEEVGIDISIVDSRDNKLGDDTVKVLHNPFAILCELINIPNDIHYHIDMVFICKANTKIIMRNDKEYSNIGWFSQHELKDLYLFPNYRILLDKAFEFINEY